MLDDLRNSSVFIDDEEPQQQEAQVVRRTVRRDKHESTFMGMTAQQRFVISLVVFFMVCVLGVLALVISGSVVLPF